MRSLIANSLPESEEPGSPHFLIRDLANAGGNIDGVPQAWAALAARYAVARIPDDAHALLMELLVPAWPKKLDTMEYQSFHLGKCAAADRINLNPDGDSDAEVAMRGLWWAAIGRAPSASPYAAIIKRVRTETRDLHATVAQREAFHAIMLREVQLEALEAAAGAKSRRALAADAEYDVIGADAAAAARPRGPPPTKPSWVKHPCVKCDSTTHPRGQPTVWRELWSESAGWVAQPRGGDCRRAAVERPPATFLAF